MRIAVIGAEGQLGADICEEFANNGDEVHRLGHTSIEISLADSVENTLSKIAPDVIVNTAAFHHVEQCELDPARAFSINACGARNLAMTSAGLDALLIHISTDYVFDGSKRMPYVERDLTQPLNVYGNT